MTSRVTVAFCGCGRVHRYPPEDLLISANLEIEWDCPRTGPQAWPLTPKMADLWIGYGVPCELVCPDTPADLFT